MEALVIVPMSTLILLIDYYNCDNTCKFVFKITTVQEYYILSVYWAFSFCIGVKIFVLAIAPFLQP